MKICHITTVHPDGDVRIFHKMCVSLATSNDFQVSCIVPNCETRVESGVNIISFSLDAQNRSSRIRLASKKALGLAIKQDADIYHLHDPELLTIALKLKKKTGARVIFDSHEDVPKQLMDKIWIPSYQRVLISKLYAIYERFVCSRLDGVISVTPLICNRFRKFQPNVEMIANYPDLLELNILEKNRFSRTICYVGGIFRTRGIIELVNAIDKIEVRLLLAGTFESDELKETVMNLPGWENVQFFGQVSRTEIASILNQSEIGIVTLHPTQSYVEAYPIKMFEYMASGTAVLASDFPLWREIIFQSNCGKCVDPMDVSAIRASLIEMLENSTVTRNQGKNGLLAAKNIYNWEKEFIKLKAFYSGLAQHR
jgi:glycosyltransferase involved in cell wall biosynthesis